jgi:hypothetical protein
MSSRVNFDIFRKGVIKSWRITTKSRRIYTNTSPCDCGDNKSATLRKRNGSSHLTALDYAAGPGFEQQVPWFVTCSNSTGAGPGCYQCEFTVNSNHIDRLDLVLYGPLALEWTFKMQN